SEHDSSSILGAVFRQGVIIPHCLPTGSKFRRLPGLPSRHDWQDRHDRKFIIRLDLANGGGGGPRWGPVQGGAPGPDCNCSSQKSNSTPGLALSRRCGRPCIPRAAADSRCESKLTGGNRGNGELQFSVSSVASGSVLMGRSLSAHAFSISSCRMPLGGLSA